MARFSYFGAAAMRQLRSMGCLTKWVSAKAASTVHSAASTKCSWRLSTATSTLCCKQTSTICGVGPPRAAIIRSFEKILGSNPRLKPAFYKFAPLSWADRISSYACASGAGWNYSRKPTETRSCGDRKPESLPRMSMPASFRPFLSQISMGCSFWRAPYRNGCKKEDSCNDNEGPRIKFL